MEYIGKQISKETLRGRNYFQCMDGNFDYDNPGYEFEDLGENVFDVTDFDYEEITAVVAMDYISERLAGSMMSKMNLEKKDEKYVWMKCLPLTYSKRESYFIICIYVDKHFKIKDYNVFIRIVEKPLFTFSLGDSPAKGTLDSYCGVLPDDLYTKVKELYGEMNNLCAGKYLHNDFRIKGKKLPEKFKEKLDNNMGENIYSFYQMSGFRDAGCSCRMEVDDNMIVQDVTFETYQNEREMITRPVGMSNDYADFYDCMLYISDNWE